MCWSKEACSSSRSGSRPRSGCSCEMYSAAAVVVVVGVGLGVGVGVGVVFATAVGDEEVSDTEVSGIQERGECDFLNRFIGDTD